MKYSLILPLLLAAIVAHAAEQRKADKKEWKRNYEDAVAARRSGQLTKALESLSRAEADAHSRNEYHLGYTHGERALVYSAQGDLTGSIAEWQKAVAAAEAVKGRTAPEMFTFLRGLSNAHQSNRQYAEAETLLLETQELVGKKFGRYSFAMRLVHDELGELYLACGDLDKAQASFEASLALSKSRNHHTTVDPYRMVNFSYRDPLSVVATHLGLGTVAQRRKDFARAEEHFKQAVERAEKEEKANGFNSEPSIKLALLCTETAKHDLATEQLKHVLARLRQTKAPASQMVRPLLLTARAEVAAGRHERAGAALGEAELLLNADSDFTTARSAVYHGLSPEAAVILTKGAISFIEAKAGANSARLVPHLDRLQADLRKLGRDAESNDVNGRSLQIRLSTGL